MAGEPLLTIVGNLTGDAELRFTAGGDAVANFTVASTPRTYDSQTREYVDGETLFMRCTAWKELAENVAESLRKGDRALVLGRLKSRSFETREGEKRTVTELDVDEVGPSLRWAQAKPAKTGRGGQSRPSGGQGRPQGGQQRGAQRRGGYAPQADPWTQQGAGQNPGGWGGQSEEPPF